MYELMTNLVFPIISTAIGAGIGGLISYHIAKYKIDQDRKMKYDAYCIRIDNTVKDMFAHINEIATYANDIMVFQSNIHVYEVALSNFKLKAGFLENAIIQLQNYWSEDHDNIILGALTAGKSNHHDICAENMNHIPGLIEKTNLFLEKASPIKNYIHEHTISGAEVPLSSIEVCSNLREGDMNQLFTEAIKCMNELKDLCDCLLQAVKQNM